jgi:hypothetical protein
MPHYVYSQRQIFRALNRLTCSVPLAGACYGLGVNAANEAADAGRIKTITKAKKKRVALTAPIRADLGLPPHDLTAVDTDEAP